ncbi:hypothetical protein DFH06DRAFT_1081207 [Mycena polygramma]|nr:hypothetical protein DFH06DRAFT_1081207 [Mycena polygramma]
MASSSSSQVAGPVLHPLTNPLRIKLYLAFADEDDDDDDAKIVWEPVLNIPVELLFHLSKVPLKWLRFIAWVLYGSTGQLCVLGEDGQTTEVLDYTAVSHLRPAYYYLSPNPARYIDGKFLDDRTSDSGSQPRGDFAKHVLGRDGTHCIVRQRLAQYLQKRLGLRLQSCHLIPYSKKAEYVERLNEIRSIAPDDRLTGIDDPRNGIVLGSDLHGFLGQSYIAFLLVPNVYLNTDDVVYIPAPDGLPIPDGKDYPEDFIPHAGDESADDAEDDGDHGGDSLTFELDEKDTNDPLLTPTDYRLRLRRTNNAGGEDDDEDADADAAEDDEDDIVYEDGYDSKPHSKLVFQRLVVGDDVDQQLEHFPHGSEAAFRSTFHIGSPSPVSLHLAYGAAVLQRWGSHRDLITPCLDAATNDDEDDSSGFDLEGPAKRKGKVLPRSSKRPATFVNKLQTSGICDPYYRPSLQAAAVERALPEPSALVDPVDPVDKRHWAFERIISLQQRRAEESRPSAEQPRAVAVPFTERPRARARTSQWVEETQGPIISV